MIMIRLLEQLVQARQAAGITQAQLAERSGLSSMAVQKAESGNSDPRLSTLEVMARALGMELMLVPAALRAELQQFVQSGGRLLGQRAGIEAPPSVVEEIVQGSRAVQRRGRKS